ncbi:chemotaxis protein CheA, partial [Achromatium sp. WMS2]
KLPGYKYADHNYPVRYLGLLLGIANDVPPEGQRTFPLLLVRSGEHRVAIRVDHIIGHSQIVMKSVGPQLSSVRWISGGTILVNGKVALILDMSALVRMDVIHTTREIGPTVDVEKQILAMVVDDSISVRRVTTKFLRKNNIEFMEAKDGMDALSQLQERMPDVILSDVEMPRMDGYELARQVRSSVDPKISRIPIIMITSRIGDKHRKMGMELGVKRYLGKPYQEAELLDDIYAVLAETEVNAQT